MSDKPWKIFENRLQAETRSMHITINKIPEDVKYIRGKIIRKKTQFDFAGGIDGLCFVFDAKACGKSTFYFASYLLAKQKIHQWVALQAADEVGNIAGLMIHFYEDGLISWANAQSIREALERGDKGLKPGSPGVISIKDNNAINLRMFMESDLLSQVENIRGCRGRRS